MVNTQVALKRPDKTGHFRTFANFTTETRRHGGTEARSAGPWHLRAVGLNGVPVWPMSGRGRVDCGGKCLCCSGLRRNVVGER